MTFTPGSPAADGFRMPPEWARHEATWLAWPHREDDWPGKFGCIPWAFAEIVRGLSPGEPVYLLVRDDAHEQSARNTLSLAGIDEDRIRFLRIPTDRGWMRDSGPICVVRNEERRIVDFGFTAWAKYPETELDDQTAARAAGLLSLPIVEPLVDDTRFVLEGGAIDLNGGGTVITTEECLLDPETQVRNPGLSRETVEQALRDFLGVTAILWLGKGIAGDDTHGHVDDLCRFVNETTVVLCREDNPADENHTPLCENRERLQDMRLANGDTVDVIDLPMPSPLYFDSVRLPASYANFYIANDRVLVPTFNDPADAKAIGILQDCFPGRTVVGIHAVDLVWGFGTLHCLTQQLPAAGA